VLVVATNTADVAVLKQELALPEDVATGVVYAASPLEGGALKGISATYLPDGTVAPVKMRAMAEAAKADFIK
jgi:hypothetical protein